jgi:cell division protease FtsH
MEKKQQQFSIWYFLAAFLFILAVQNYVFAPHTANLAYSDFKTLLKEGKVNDLALVG